MVQSYYEEMKLEINVEEKRGRLKMKDPMALLVRIERRKRKDRNIPISYFSHDALLYAFLYK